MTDKPENMSLVWGEQSDKAPIDEQDFKNGWPFLNDAGDPQVIKSSEMNFLQNKMTSFMAHVNENGIPVWDSGTEYPQGAWTLSPVDRQVYISRTDSNTNAEPSASLDQWSLLQASQEVGDTTKSYLDKITMESRGYLNLNGQAVSRTTYSKLFDLLGTTYGEGDGSTTFNLPGSPLSTLNDFGGLSAPQGTIVKVCGDGKVYLIFYPSGETAHASEKFCNVYQEVDSDSATQINFPGGFDTYEDVKVSFYSDDSLFFSFFSDSLDACFSLNGSVWNDIMPFPANNLGKEPVPAGEDQNGNPRFSSIKLAFFDEGGVYLSYVDSDHYHSYSIDLTPMLEDACFPPATSNLKLFASHLFFNTSNENLTLFYGLTSKNDEPIPPEDSYFPQAAQFRNWVEEDPVLTPCATSSDVIGYYSRVNIDFPSQHNGETYVGLYNDSDSGIIAKLKDDISFEKVSDLPDGHFFAGITNDGSIYTYTKPTETTRILWLNNGDGLTNDWIKAL